MGRCIGRGERGTRLAVATITVTVMALSLGDALIKAMSVSFSIWQIFVLRSILTLPALALMLKARGTRLALRKPGWSIVRSIMLVAMWLLYYSALPVIPLSVAAAVYYTLPIFITVFAAVFLSEKIGATGLSAILMGFIGILLILRPTASEFSAHALLPLGSAVLYALAMILTRTKCRTEDPMMLSLALNVAFVAAGVAGIFGAGSLGGSLVTSIPWSPMGAAGWGAMCLLAVSMLVGSIGAAFAYQVGRPSTVAVFDFAYVGFAAVWGFLFFDEIPGRLTLAGMALIVFAGVLAIRAGTRSGPELQT